MTRVLTSPLRPDDYFALLNPRWSTRELTGTVVRVRRETADAATIVIKPDYAWDSHRPGQYLRIGMEIDGIRHWRAYTITSDPDHPEGVVSVTVKHTEGGKMSPVFTRYVQPGQTVFLGDIEGEFMLPDPVPDKMLFLSAGSGITPIWSMLRELERRDAVNDSVHVPRRLPPARDPHRRPTPFRPGPARRRLPGLARTRDLPVRPPRAHRRGRGAGGEGGPVGTPAHRTVPARHRQRRR
jgi:hypothetical protein